MMLTTEKAAEVTSVREVKSPQKAERIDKPVAISSHEQPEEDNTEAG